MFTGIPATAQPGGRVVVWALRLLVAAGIVAIVVAWAQASDSVEVSSQVDWAPVGLAGTATVAAALLGSVLVARQAIAIRLARLAPSIAEASGEPASVAAAGFSGLECPNIGHSRPEKLGGDVPSGADRGKSRGAVAAEALVAAGSMARFHRASCPLTAGKPVRPETRQAHEEAGRRPCGVCAP